MNSMLYIGMGFILLGFIGLIGVGCLAGLLISIMSDSRGETWAAFKSGSRASSLWRPSL
jgi:hypothetical protein